MLILSIARQYKEVQYRKFYGVILFWTLNIHFPSFHALHGSKQR